MDPRAEQEFDKQPASIIPDLFRLVVLVLLLLGVAWGSLALNGAHHAKTGKPFGQEAAR